MQNTHKLRNIVINIQLARLPSTLISEMLSEDHIMLITHLSLRRKMAISSLR